MTSIRSKADGMCCVGKLQQRYHMAREAAEQQIEDWVRTVGEESRTSSNTGESIQSAYEHWFEHMVDMQRQSIALLSQRMGKAMELPARFAECRNPADVAKAQAEFASMMVADYFEAGRQMLNVLTDATLAEAQSEAIDQQVQRPKPRRGR